VLAGGAGDEAEAEFEAEDEAEDDEDSAGLAAVAAESELAEACASEDAGADPEADSGDFEPPFPA
jgi:hypothetical protein